MEGAHRLGLRWTIGDVSERGFVALGLSIWGAWRLFGPAARYVVCANTVPIRTMQARVGVLPEPVEWIDAAGRMPAWLRSHVDGNWAEGVAWKFSPLQIFPDRKELALDNDCILWDIPDALAAWLADDGDSVLIAEDVKVCFGQFATLCGSQPRNSGIRGLPAGFDLEAALSGVLREHPVTLSSELDEQGLQVAALTRDRTTHVVRV